MEHDKLVERSEYETVEQRVTETTYQTVEQTKQRIVCDLCTTAVSEIIPIYAGTGRRTHGTPTEQFERADAGYCVDCADVLLEDAPIYPYPGMRTLSAEEIEID